MDLPAQCWCLLGFRFGKNPIKPGLAARVLMTSQMMLLVGAGFRSAHGKWGLRLCELLCNLLSHSFDPLLSLKQQGWVIKTGFWSKSIIFFTVSLHRRWSDSPLRSLRVRRCCASSRQRLRTSTPQWSKCAINHKASFTAKNAKHVCTQWKRRASEGCEKTNK